MWEKFEDYKNDCLDIAEQWHYPKSVIDEIKAAKNDGELSSVMTRARKKYYKW